MTHDPPVHQRRSIRLKGYDYAQAGAYFITICTYQREYFFGDIVRAGLAPAQMQLNELGQIALEQWYHLPERFGSIELDAFVVMPNHIHGIIIIHDPVGAGFTSALDDETTNIEVGARPTHTLIPTGQPQGFTPALGDETANIGVGASPTYTLIPTGQPQGFTPALDDETANIGVGASPTHTLIPTGQPQGFPLRNANI